VVAAQSLTAAAPACLRVCPAFLRARAAKAQASLPPPVHPWQQLEIDMDRSRLVLIATAFGLGMAQLDVTAVNVAVPAVQASLHTDVRGLSWVIDGYTLAFASLLLLAGGMGDRLGARRIFVAGLVVFTVASGLCAAAPDLTTLIVARIVQGTGAALFMPSSLAILRQEYPEPVARARAIGVWSALTAIAAASGPILGGVMVSAFGWRSIFYLNVPVGIVAVVMALRFVRPSPRSPGQGFDALAQSTAAISLALFTWALIERSARGWGSPLILGAIALSLAGLRLFTYLEDRSPRPILPLTLFTSRTFSATASSALLYAAAFFGSVLVYSIYFQDVRGDSPALAGLHIAAITSSFGLTSVVAGRVAGRYGTRASILSGLGLLSVSAFWSAALPPSGPFLALLPALVLMGIGAGFVAPAMNAAILASVPPALSGIGAGVLNASRQVGTALGVAVFASQFHGISKAAAARGSLFWAGAVYLVALALATRATAGIGDEVPALLAQEAAH
jgi:DHA2 family methylenomycin A resistance protein-like MFS transporter